MNDSKLLDMCINTKWDGVDRISKLSNIFDVVDGHEKECLNNAITWLIQCCAAWDGNRHIKIKPPVNRYPYMLLLIGIDPTLATELFKHILPDEFIDYQTSIEFDSNDKYSITESIDYSISILTGFNLNGDKDTIIDYVEYLNIFLYLPIDTFRRSYGRYWKPKIRTTCFAGTVDSPASLIGITNDTHNFLPVYLNSIDFDLLLQLDKHQLWAQIWKMYTT